MEVNGIVASCYDCDDLWNGVCHGGTSINLSIFQVVSLLFLC